MLEVAKGIQNNSKFTRFLSEATNTQSRPKDLYEKQEKNIELLHEARGEIISTFQDMRKTFNQIFDELEENSMKEMDKLLSLMTKQVTIDKDACFNVHDKIQNLLDYIQNTGKRCDELAFQGFKKCSEELASADSLLSSMQNVDFQLKFSPDAMIEQYLYSLKTFGTFRVIPENSIVDRIQTSELSKPLIQHDYVYSYVNKQTYNIKTRDDTCACYISGICQLPTGQTVIVDNSNSKVKLLSKAVYLVIDELKLPIYAEDVCHITGTDMAVTLWDWKDDKYISNQIWFVQAWKGKLSHIRTVLLDHACGGIAYRNCQLYVGSWNALYLYKLSGEKVTKLYEDKSGDYTTVHRFTLSEDGSKIYITNCKRSLIVSLDSSGLQLSTLSDPEIFWPRDVCVAENGSVLVCGRGSHTVIQVDREGRRKLATLTTEAKGVRQPISLCFIKQAQKLLLGQDGDHMLALQLKQTLSTENNTV